MIRFTTHTPSQNETVVRVEGHLTGESLEDLRQLVDSFRSRTISVDLSGVMSVDATSRDYLKEIRRAGNKLSGGSMYIQALIEEAES